MPNKKRQRIFSGSHLFFALIFLYGVLWLGGLALRSAGLVAGPPPTGGQYFNVSLITASAGGNLWYWYRKDNTTP